MKNQFNNLSIAEYALFEHSELKEAGSLQLSLKKEDIIKDLENNRVIYIYSVNLKDYASHDLKIIKSVRFEIIASKNNDNKVIYEINKIKGNAMKKVQLSESKNINSYKYTTKNSDYIMHLHFLKNSNALTVNLYSKSVNSNITVYSSKLNIIDDIKLGAIGRTFKQLDGSLNDSDINNLENILLNTAINFF